jgi:hypothetical protein
MWLNTAARGRQNLELLPNFGLGVMSVKNDKGAGCAHTARTCARLRMPSNGEPFLTYGICVPPFSRGGVALTVFLIDRSIASEADHENAEEEAVRKLGEAIADRI